MVKKFLITSGITIVLALALFMIYLIVEKHTTKQKIRTRILTAPVDARLFALDSTLFSFPRAKPVVLVLFNSTCEHCQYELKQIKEKIAVFDEVELVFLSSEPIAAIKSEAAPFKSVRNAKFVKINPEDVYENFGVVRFPTILVYSASGNLVREFKGATKVEAILQNALWQ